MIAAGQSIGNYRIVSKIGTGGMGAVYLAEHPLIGKRVALKVIHRELASNREVVQRFYQEARAVNQIGNEHIVEIHDFGATPDGDHFYIMEYLEGQTLAELMSRDRQLDVMRALHIGAQIASALGAAHAAGVIHRDLKPDNVMLMRRLGDPDFVKVLDFGLAKMFAGGPGPVVKTAVGVLLGTPQYMSPEACESKPSIDHRTDIYALGILLFQMLCGVLPFDGESMGEVLVKQVTALPPGPRGFNPAIPPSVEQIVLTCLAKPVDARFQSMQALRDALLDPESYLRASPPIARARSVAPGEAGVDARALMAHLAQQPAKPSAEPWQVAPTIMTDGEVAAAALRAPPPGLVPPVAPVNNTMRIATPVGYSSRPPRKMWPIVLALGLMLGLIGGGFAVAWVGRGDGPTTAPTVDAVLDARAAAVTDVAPREPVRSIDAPALVTAIDGAVVASPPDAPPPPIQIDAAPAMAKLTIDSTPPGASVYGPDGTLLGKTRLEIEWPVATEPVAFELRMPGYRKRPKSIVIGGNTTIGVQLEKERGAPLPVPGKGSGSGTGSGKGSDGKRGSGTELIRPE